MLPRISSSTEKSINGPASFFHQLGNLHDSKLVTLEFNFAKQEIQLIVDDLYANFRGLPEYPGPQAARFTLGNVSAFELALTSKALPMRIIDLEVSEVLRGSHVQAVVKFDPSGLLKIDCNSISCRVA